MPAGVLVIENLRCEYLENPLGIDATAPRLSWTLASRRRGAKQTAYQILVAGSRDSLQANRGDLWDSGKVTSDETLQIAYAGKPLASRAQCFWKVRVWDQEGNPTEWSEPATWTMGLLNADDWQARWIGSAESRRFLEGRDLSGNVKTGLVLPPAPFFRREFSAQGKKIRRAVVYASALGLYELHLNGQRVGNDFFTPGWTDYKRRVYYNTYDVTERVRSGENALGAIVADGWYAGYLGFGILAKFPKARGFYGDEPRLRVQLEIEYEDGTRQIVGTDDAWRTAIGPILEADILMGETYDARREFTGWDRPNFRRDGWQPVVLGEAGQARVEAYPGVPVRRTQMLRVKKVTEPKPGVFIFDLGQNFSGWARLRVNGPAGTKVVLRHGEMLHQDGTLMTENLRKARCTDTYILRGDGDEVWEPRFTYHGFRYVEVTGYPGTPEPDAITGVVVHSDTPAVGKFACSEPMINQLWSNITWTQRANFFEVPTDCPQRDERLGWTGDAQIYVRSSVFNMDVAAFYKKWLVDLEDSRLPAGPYPNYAPWTYAWGPSPDSPAWADAGIICPHTIYQMYGDRRIIEHMWDGMVAFVDFMQKNSKGLIRPEAGHGDWLSIDENTPKDVIATAYFAYDTQLLSEMTQAIGKEAEARKYAKLSEDVRAAFNRAFVSADTRIKGDTQTCYALALYMDLLPEEKRPAAIDHLVRCIERRNWHLATGFVGVKHLLPVLTRFGRLDVAYRLLLNKTYPSWGYSIVNDATTIWERWNSYTREKGFGDPGMNSFCHYSLGSVCEWMFDTVGGINSDGVAFKRITLKPQPGGDFKFATASYDSIRGRIVSDWRVDGDQFTLRATIPANTVATVYVPAVCPDSIKERFRPAVDAEGVRFLRVEDGYGVFEVQSGEYRFTSQLK